MVLNIILKMKELLILLSNYVRVKSVNSKTLNYFDNNGNAKSALQDLFH
jgi:hypothetical protein